MKKIKHEEFVDVLFNRKVVRHNMRRMQSNLYSIGTYDIFKISLSCFDDKTYALDDGANTLALEHDLDGANTLEHKEFVRFVSMV